MISVNSYFSGGGLLDIGLMQAGLQIHQSYELDKIACKVQKHNLGNHVVQSDLTQKLVGDDNDADVMAFTYPCTKYSPIASIQGNRTGDELFLHALRHMVIKKPEAYAIENVPGMKAFPVVMEAMTKLPDYYVQVFCPIQSEIWLPQKRDRLIIIGTRKNFNFRPPRKAKQIKLREILEKDPQIKVPKYVLDRMKGRYRDQPIISDPDNNDLAPTCVAHYSKDKSTRLVKDKNFLMGVRPYTVREYARLQGVPDWFEFNCSESAAYKMIGNGVSVNAGLWLGLELKRYFNNQH